MCAVTCYSRLRNDPVQRGTERIRVPISQNHSHFFCVLKELCDNSRRLPQVVSNPISENPNARRNLQFRFVHFCSVAWK